MLNYIVQTPILREVLIRWIYFAFFSLLMKMFTVVAQENIWLIISAVSVHHPQFFILSAST